MNPLSTVSPETIHRETRHSSQRTVPSRLASSSLSGSRVAQAREKVLSRPPRSRQQLRCDSFSKARKTYRRLAVMQNRTTKSRRPFVAKPQRGRNKWHIRISIRDQLLTLCRGGDIMRSYPISSSRFGLGTEEGSMKTPLGRFKIVEKIGDNMPEGTIFRGRVALGLEEP